MGGFRFALTTRYMNHFVSAVNDGIESLQLFHTDEDVDRHLVNDKEMACNRGTAEANRELDHSRYLFVSSVGPYDENRLPKDDRGEFLFAYVVSAD